MALPPQMILVCAGKDAKRAAASGYPLLDLCLDVTAHGALGRTRLSAEDTPRYLGIRDPGPALPTINTSAFCDALLYECRRIHARGVFADFETSSAAIRRLCAALDDSLYAEDYPFFVPETRAGDVRHAIVTVETAVSGGSLRGMMSEAQAKFGAARVAALLRPVCTDFVLPARTPEGNPLEPAERDVLRETHHAQIFFSRELCAKYFTFMDEDGHGHFVLFDDESTIKEKLTQLTALNVPHLFALYPDVRTLL